MQAPALATCSAGAGSLRGRQLAKQKIIFVPQNPRKARNNQTNKLRAMAGVPPGGDSRTGGGRTGGDPPVGEPTAQSTYLERKAAAVAAKAVSAQAERGPATAHLNLRNLAADVRELREAHEGSWWKEKLRDANGMFVWSGRKQPNNDPRRLTHIDSVARQSHGAFARSLERILRHPVAELVIIGAALLSAGILAYTGPTPPDGTWTNSLLVVHDFVFTAAFSFEIMLRLVARGRAAFRDNWFRFDLAIVVVCLVHLALTRFLGDDADIPSSVLALRALRVLRVFRVVRLLHAFAHLKTSSNYSVLTLLVHGIWESRFLHLYAISFVSILSILAFAMFKDGLAMRCVVIAADSGQKLITDKQAARLFAGEAWSTIASSPPVLAQPEAYCRDSHYTAGIQSLGAHSCSNRTQQCARICQSDIDHEVSFLLTFDSLPSSLLAIFLVLLGQKGERLQKNLMQSAPLPTVLVFLFFVCITLLALVLVNYYAAIFHLTYQRLVVWCEHSPRIKDQSDAITRSQRQNDEAERKEKDRMGEGSGFQSSDVEDTKAGPTMKTTQRKEVLTMDLEQCRILEERDRFHHCRKVAGFLHRAQTFELRQIPMPLWELVLYLFALLQFIQSFARAWCLGNARMRMHGTADLGVAEMATMAAGWERLRDMCQWVFYIDLVLKLVRYRGLFPYLQADINHRLDVSATFFVVLASWTWEVPDMTALRGLRLFSLCFFGRVYWWNRGSTVFFGKILSCQSDIFHCAILLIIAGLMLQHLSDGLPRSNRFFGSFCASITSIMRLSANTDLIPIIRARIDVDGAALIVLVLLVSFGLATMFGKMIIAAMYCGLCEKDEMRQMYQLFMSRAIQEHPQLYEWLQNLGTGQHRSFHILCQAQRLLEHNREEADSYELKINERKLKRHREAVQWDSVGADSQKVIEIALYMLEDLIEHQNQDDSVGKSIQPERKAWHQAYPAAFLPKRFMQKTAQVLILGQRYARKCLRRPAVLFVLDSFSVIPSAALVFTCSPDGCWLGHHVQGLEIFLATVFFLEMMLKMYAFGLRGPHAYFRGPQTCFDTVILFLWWLSFLKVLPLSSRVLYGTRIFRLWHWLCGWIGIQWVGLMSLPALSQEFPFILISLFSFILILCPMLLQSYSGRWNHCNDPVLKASSAPDKQCIGQFSSSFSFNSQDSVQIYKPRSTVSTILHFDDVGSSVFSLLVLSVQDGWSETLNNALGFITQATTADDASTGWSVVPLLCFQFFVYIFVWPCSLAVFIYSQRKFDGSALQTRDQIRWRATLRCISLKHAAYTTSEEIFFKWAFNVSVSAIFERTSNVIVFVNIVCTVLELSLDHDASATAFHVVNLLCLVIFFLEMFVKVLASPVTFFTSMWGVFDVFVNFTTLIEMLLSIQNGGGQIPSGSGAQALRSLRAVRILKAFSSHQMLRLLSQVSIPIIVKARGPIAMLIFSVFCFAALAMQIPGHLDEGSLARASTSENYSTFPRAFAFSWGVIFGDGILPVIEYFDVMCPSAQSGMANACETAGEIANLLLLVYAFGCRFILVPMIVAAVFNVFLDEYDLVLSLINSDDLSRFEECWTMIDVKREGFIPVWKLRLLVQNLRTKKCSLHFDIHDERRMQFLVQRLHDLFLADPNLEMGMRARVSLTMKCKLLFEKSCHGWVYAARVPKARKLYGFVRYDWVALLLVYIRDFPQNIPLISRSEANVAKLTTIEGRMLFELLQRERIYAGLVRLHVMMSLPKFRRRLVAKKKTLDLNEQGPKKQKRSRITPVALETLCTFSMLEHPRFSLEWLGVTYFHECNVSMTKVVAVQKETGRTLNRNEFREHLAKIRSSPLYHHLTHDAPQFCSASKANKSHASAATAIGAICGEQSPPDDPFLEFEVFTENFGKRIVEVVVHMSVAESFMNGAKRGLMREALTAVARIEIIQKACTEVVEFVTEEPKEQPKTHIHSVVQVDQHANMVPISAICVHIECHDMEDAKEVVTKLTDDLINRELRRLHLPMIKTVSGPDIREPVAPAEDIESGPLSIEARMSAGHDEAEPCDTVSIAITMDAQFSAVDSVHNRYAFALVLVTDLALALECAENQVRIQDIFSGRSCTHVHLCLTSNELHAASAQSLGEKLISEVHKMGSDLRTLLPSVASAHWIPDLVRTGLNARYNGEFDDATTRSQLSYLDTHRAGDRGCSEQRQRPEPRRLKCNKSEPISNQVPAGILKTDEAPAECICPHCHPKFCNKTCSCDIVSFDFRKNNSSKTMMTAWKCVKCGYRRETKSTKGRVSARKWSKILDQNQVTILLSDKLREANRIFDTLDVDESGSLSQSEILVGLLANGFEENEIAARLPAVMAAANANHGQHLSRETFVELWLQSRDDDPSRLFDRLDLDRKGVLSHAELRAGLIDEGFHLAEIQHRIPLIFAAIGGDNDGAISKAEFVERWNHLSPATLNYANYPFEPELDATGLTKLLPDEAKELLSEVTTKSTRAFGALGSSLIAPLPDHIQDMILPIPSTMSPARSEFVAKTVDRPRRGYNKDKVDKARAVAPRATSTMIRRSQVLSPREMLARAFDPLMSRGPRSPAEQGRHSGWAAGMRNFLPLSMWSAQAATESTASSDGQFAVQAASGSNHPPPAGATGGVRGPPIEISSPSSARFLSPALRAAPRLASGTAEQRAQHK